MRRITLCCCLLKVQTLDHNYVESLFLAHIIIFGDVSRCNAWVLGKDTGGDDK